MAYTIQTDLRRVKEWAQEKAKSGSEPPWAWYQLMKLVEAISAIQQGMESTTTANSPREVERRGKLIQLAAAKCSQDNAPRCPDEERVPLPM